MVEPNPHFVPFFDQNRAKFPKLDIQDMKQVKKKFYKKLKST